MSRVLPPIPPPSPIFLGAFAAVLVVGGFVILSMPSPEPPTFASAPEREDLEQAARAACADRGQTLRALAIFYDTTALPVGGKVFCGAPRRSKA